LTFHPYSNMPGDLAVHSCTNAQVYDFSQGSSYYQTATSGNFLPPSAGGCVDVVNGTNAVCPTYATGVPTAPCQYQWYHVPFPLVHLASGGAPVGSRLVVDSTSFGAGFAGDPPCDTFNCGGGYHSYGIEVCDTDPTEPVKGCITTGNGGPAGIVGPWNNMDLRIIPPSNSTVNAVPLAQLDTQFAGRTITISIFDPGDSITSASADHFLT